MQMVLLRRRLQFDCLGTNVIAHADMARRPERARARVCTSTLVGEPIGLRQAGCDPHAPAQRDRDRVPRRRHPRVHRGLDHRPGPGPDDHGGRVKMPLADMKLVSDPHVAWWQCMLGGVVKTAEEEAAEASPTEPGSSPPEARRAARPGARAQRLRPTPRPGPESAPPAAGAKARRRRQEEVIRPHRGSRRRRTETSGVPRHSRQTRLRNSSSVWATGNDYQKTRHNAGFIIGRSPVEKQATVPRPPRPDRRRHL